MKCYRTEFNECESQETGLPAYIPGVYSVKFCLARFVCSKSDPRISIEKRWSPPMGTICRPLLCGSICWFYGSQRVLLEAKVTHRLQYMIAPNDDNISASIINFITPTHTVFCDTFFFIHIKSSSRPILAQSHLPILPCRRYSSVESRQ